MRNKRAIERARTMRKTPTIEAAGFTVIRVNERVVRDGIDHVCAWISQVGAMISNGEVVSDVMKRMDTVPLP